MSLDTRQHLEQDPWGIKESSGYINNAVNSSPRSKATRVSYTQSEYQIMVAFIKSNLQLFLRIISSDIHNKEVSLSATEFNTLRILFKVQSAEGRPLDNMSRPKSANSNSKPGNKPLSTFTTFFQSSHGGPPQNSTSTKVHMGVIIEWISNLLHPIEPVEGILKMNNLNKCVTMKSY